MSSLNRHSSFTPLSYLFLSGLTLSLAGCGSSSSDSSASYVMFYNASQNSPGIHLTIDEDLETSEDDEVEVTFSAIDYGETLTRAEFEAKTYTYELAWQDDDSRDRDDLEMIHQSELQFNNDTLHFIVLSDDIQQPTVNVYDIPIIDEEDDDTYDRFNVRILNLHEQESNVDLYISETDETFNEATLVTSASFNGLTDNQKLDQGSYILYLTRSGESDVLFKSNDVSFSYSAQYILSIRENVGAGGSPFVIDRISNSTTAEYTDVDSEAQFTIYNAIATHELLEGYQGTVDVEINGNPDMPIVTDLAIGELSESITTGNGDYSIDVTANGTNVNLLKNHLLSLPENTNRTLFLYADEEAVDEDGDGDVDEDGDGLIDEKEVNVYSLVVDNSVIDGIYSHQVSIVNLIDTDDFGSVTVYFVKSDETIDTASNSSTLAFSSNDVVTLNNNTYQVFVVARENSSDMILNSFELVLNEQSNNQFLVLELDENTPTGYRATLVDQAEVQQ